MIRALSFALAASTLLASSAGASPALEELCPALSTEAQMLAQKHDEEPIASFYNHRSALFIFVNPTSQSWTIIATRGLGEKCQIKSYAAGRGWFIKPPGAGL